ncbi:MAG: MarR family transcriptional regulator [Lachnospiraceae bacterium]|nr:MarR family transcriptional regulator [Lachnospiraceae bacterium]
MIGKQISISATELLYLSSLYKKDGISQDDLAQEYSVDKAAVTRTLQLMEKRNLLFAKQIVQIKGQKSCF